VPDACRHPDRILPDADFSSAIYGGADDGADVFIVADAAVCPTWDGVHVVGYGNVRPWLARSAPTEPLQTQVSLGGQVKRRYLVRDGQFVMVRDPNLGAADGVGLQAWFFLPTACVTEAPPPPPPPPPDAATPPPPQSMPSGLLRPTPPRWPTPPGRPARTRRPTTPQTWRAQTPSPPQTRWTGPRAVTLAAKTSGPRRSV
jgi:hypothetical protein